MKKNQLIIYTAMVSGSGVLGGLGVGIFLTNQLRLPYIWAMTSFMLMIVLITISDMLYRNKYRDFLCSLK